MHETDALDRNFEDWCYLRKTCLPQFQYWAAVLELQLLLLVYVHSLRQASLTMYLDALTELAPGCMPWTILLCQVDLNTS